MTTLTNIDWETVELAAAAMKAVDEGEAGYPNDILPYVIDMLLDSGWLEAVYTRHETKLRTTMLGKLALARINLERPWTPGGVKGLVHTEED